MAGKFNLELKVGIFVFIGLIILTLAVFSISEVYIFRPGYMINASFHFASGIDVGAPVRVAGIQAGEVKQITMVYDEEEDEANVILSVWLEDGIKIPRDSIAFMSMLGLIGETYLEVVPGNEYAHLLQEGDTLVGRNPVSTDTVMEIVRNAADNFNKVLNSVSDLLDEKTRTDFKTTVDNINSFTGNLDQTLDQETKTNLKETIQNFRDFSASAKVITERLERGEGKLGGYLQPTRGDIKRREEKEKQEKKKSEPTTNF